MTVNGSGDLFMLHEARAFIGQEVEVVKITKAGLVEVRLGKQRMSFPQRNISPLEELEAWAHLRRQAPLRVQIPGSWIDWSTVRGVASMPEPDEPYEPTGAT